MVIMFLALSRRLFAVSICPQHRVISSPPSHELTVHVTCLHASTNCAITINISTMKTEAICSSEEPVCTYKSVWYHNTLTKNRIHYKTDKTSLNGQQKWEEIVARFEVISAVLLKHINPGKQTFRVSKDCDIKQAP